MRSIGTELRDLEKRVADIGDGAEAQWLAERMEQKRCAAEDFDWNAFAEHLESMLVYAARPTFDTPRESIHEVVESWHSQMRHSVAAVDELGVVDHLALGASIERETDRIAGMESEEWEHATRYAAGRREPPRR